MKSLNSYYTLENAPIGTMFCFSECVDMKYSWILFSRHEGYVAVKQRLEGPFHWNSTGAPIVCVGHTDKVIPEETERGMNFLRGLVIG